MVVVCGGRSAKAALEREQEQLVRGVAKLPLRRRILSKIGLIAFAMTLLFTGPATQPTRSRLFALTRMGRMIIRSQST